jgi:SAM-dependent methyltransferase
MSGKRASNEIEHGRYLAERDPDVAWGWGTPAGQRRAERRARLIAEGAGLRPGMRVLEIGCGTGLFTAHFAATGAEILAVDISADLLALARQRRGAMPNVRFQLAQFEELATAEQFDAVIGSSVLHHLDIDLALRHAYRLLKPGGAGSFAEPNLLNPQIFLERHVPAIRRRLHVSPDETAFVRWRFAATLSRHGFEQIEMTPFDWLHPYTPAGVMAPVQAIGRVLERLPLVREFAGSLAIRCRKPRAS